MKLTIPLLQELVAYAEMDEPVHMYPAAEGGEQIGDRVPVRLEVDDSSLRVTKYTELSLWDPDGTTIDGVVIAVPESSRGVFVPFFTPTTVWSGCTFGASDIQITVGDITDGPHHTRKESEGPDQGALQKAWRLLRNACHAGHGKQRDA